MFVVKTERASALPHVLRRVAGMAIEQVASTLGVSLATTGRIAAVEEALAGMRRDVGGEIRWRMNRIEPKALAPPLTEVRLAQQYAAIRVGVARRPWGALNLF
jgi:hypothetical protein